MIRRSTGAIFATILPPGGNSTPMMPGVNGRALIEATSKRGCWSAVQTDVGINNPTTAIKATCRTPIYSSVQISSILTGAEDHVPDAPCWRHVGNASHAYVPGGASISRHVGSGVMSKHRERSERCATL